MEWTKSETLRFIELWRDFPCLWNNKHRDYKHRQKRRNALSHLAQQMSIDINVVEKKIISLKTQFNREIHKLKTKSEAGLDEAQSSCWYAYEHLLFLKGLSNIRRHSIMVAKTENEQEAELTIEENEYTPEITLQQSQPRSVPFKRKQDSHQSGLNDTPNVITNKQRTDELTIFGESVASELREIKCKRRLLMLKKEIMELVFKTKIEIIDSENDEGVNYSIY